MLSSGLVLQTLEDKQIMGLFDRLFGRHNEDEKQSEDSLEAPWDRSPSIYQFIKSHHRPEQHGLPEGFETLPDEERLANSSEISWSAGAMDGVLTHHWGGTDEENDEKLLKLVQTYWTTPTLKNKVDVYNFVVEKNVIGVIDQFIKGLAQLESVNHDRLYDLARSFATEASDREPVKFGIAILGLYEQPSDLEIFRTLGRHDEFTLFCAVALSNCSEYGEKELWELAKNVDGWGRIQTVERLAGTENNDIKEWMLREGFKNSVMYEYLAYTCATSGGLLGALSQETVDQELLTASGEIIEALIMGGPAQSIDDYDDGAIVVDLYLEHIQQQGHNISQFLAVASIRDFLSYEESDWNTRKDHGWSKDKRITMKVQCDAIIGNPVWRDRAMEGLQSSSELEFYNAERAAQVLGIDTWKFHWERLEQSPLESGRWYHVMRHCDDKRIEETLGLAVKCLPLNQISTGPAMETGLGLEWQPHSCLDFILQELRRFPGKGIELIEVGLRSPVIRNRNMALKALSEWDKDVWPDSVDPFLQQALSDEPDKDVRERIEKVIAGEALE